VSRGSRLYFPLDEYRARWDGALSEVADRGYEAAVLWQRTGGSYDRAGDVWYLSGYASHASGQEPSVGANAVGRAFAALVLRVGHDPQLHIMEPVGTVDPELVAVEDIVAHDRNLALGLAERLKAQGVEGRVAYVGDDFLPAQLYRHLTEATPQIEWVWEPTLLYALQRKKSPRELDLYREAGEVVSRAMTALMEGLIAGKRQSDAAADAAHIIVSAGGGIQRIAVQHGHRASFAMWDKPFYSYSTDAPEPGDIVRAWLYGPILEGYWIDPGRTAVCGNDPTPAQRKLIEDGVALTGAIVDAVRPGTTPREVGALGDRVTRELGYDFDVGGAIWPIYGHGLGLYFASPKLPAHGVAETIGDDKLQWNIDTEFFDGEVYAVETFLTAPEVVGMVGMEDVFIVRADGPEILTTTPKVFW
jgi:Xaa-Pro aminopeptidase